MTVKWLVPGHHFIELLEEIMFHIRIGVFIDRYPRGGVRDVNQDLTLPAPGASNDLLQTRGEVDHLVSVSGLDFEAMHGESILPKRARRQRTVREPGKTAPRTPFEGHKQCNFIVFWY